MGTGIRSGSGSLGPEAEILTGLRCGFFHWMVPRRFNGFLLRRSAAIDQRLFPCFCRGRAGLTSLCLKAGTLAGLRCGFFHWMVPRRFAGFLLRRGAAIDQRLFSCFRRGRADLASLCLKAGTLTGLRCGFFHWMVCRRFDGFLFRRGGGFAGDRPRRPGVVLFQGFLHRLVHCLHQGVGGAVGHPGLTGPFQLGFRLAFQRLGAAAAQHIGEKDAPPFPLAFPGLVQPRGRVSRVGLAHLRRPASCRRHRRRLAGQAQGPGRLAGGPGRRDGLDGRNLPGLPDGLDPLPRAGRGGPVCGGRAARGGCRLPAGTGLAAGHHKGLDLGLTAFQPHLQPVDHLLLLAQLPLLDPHLFQDAGFQVSGFDGGPSGRRFFLRRPGRGGLFGGVHVNLQVHLHLHGLGRLVLALLVLQQGQGQRLVGPCRLPLQPLFQLFLKQAGQKPKGRQAQAVLPHHRHILFGNRHLRGIHCKSTPHG